MMFSKNKFFKNKFFITSLLVVIIFLLVLLICTVFISNNFLSLKRHLNTKNISEIVVVDDKHNKTTMHPNDYNFNEINNILKNSKMIFYSERLLEYDTEKDYIELKRNGKTKAIYTDSLENGKIVLIVCDFFKNSDTPTKIDHPYYITAEITPSDFYSIFPNSTLLSNNCISIDITINNQSSVDNKFAGKLSIRNDNDCAIRLEKIDSNDKDISILVKDPKDIAPHSNSEIDLIFNTTKDIENVKKHMKSFKFIFSSSINSNDTCEVLS